LGWVNQLKNVLGWVNQLKNVVLQVTVKNDLIQENDGGTAMKYA